MRIYDGSPRQDFEEVFRAIGAQLDAMGMREILIDETPEGFLVQGLVIQGATGVWSDSVGTVTKETFMVEDDRLSTSMDEALARRGGGAVTGAPQYEAALRVIGRYIDEQRPRDMFLFEQDGAYVLRLLQANQTGTRHELVEFTRDDITEMIARGPTLRSDSLRSRLSKSSE
jgi:hypothetical protein